MKPSLIIGIGGSGMAIGHSLKYLFNSYLPEELNSNVRFLFFENDKNEFETRLLTYVRNQKSLINKDEIIKLTDFNAYDIVQKLIKYDHGKAKLVKDYKETYEWLDLTKYYPPIKYEEGLAANRMVGRLCGDVYSKTILPSIQNAADDILKLDQVKKDFNSLNVFVITSSCGGTGSSLFFDISAYIDHCFNVRTMINKTLFLINSNYFLDHKRDNGFLDDSDEFKNIQVNSWAFIDECEYFISKYIENPSEMGNYVTKPSLFKSRVDNREVILPFSSGIVFDQITSNKAPIPKGTFYEAISNIIFYSLTSASDDEFRSYIGVNKFKEKEGRGGKFDLNQEMQYKYGSLGIKTVRFPKEELSKYFETRYLYEIFSNKLLDENPKEKIIKSKADEFVNDVFGKDLKSTLNAFKIPIEGKFSNELYTNRITSQVEFRRKYVENKLRLFTEPDSDKCKEENEIIAEFERHKKDIYEFNDTVNKIYLNLRQTPGLSFNVRFTDDGQVADHTRKLLWRRVYEVIKETGYYGVVGRYSNNVMIKGFLEEIRDRLYQLYKEITNEYINCDTTRVEHDLEESRIKILKNSKKLIGRAKVSAISKDLDNYVKRLEDIRNIIIQKYNLVIMQGILFEFAVGDAERSLLINSAYPEQKSEKTELRKYEDELKYKLGIISLSMEDNPVSLIKMFDDGSSNNETIRNNYVRYLRNEFRDSSKDIFSMLLPFDLGSLLDENAADGWKKNTLVDKKFRGNIKITANEIAEIFEMGEDSFDAAVLLSKMEELDKKSTLRDALKKINKKIINYCRTTYINNTENEIGDFLNKNISTAYNESTPKKQEKVKSDVIFPVHTENIGGLRKYGPYINCNSSLVGFVKKVLGFKEESKIVANPNLEHTKIVFVKYIEGISYEEIYGNKLAQYVYLNRNIDLFKPFLHKIWNRKVRGPWGDTEEFILKLNIDGNERTFEYLDALAFCIGMDLLFQKDNMLAEKLFITDEEYLKNKKIINRSPVHYDSALKQFVYYTNAEINDKAEKGVEKLWIEDSLIRSKKKLLPLSEEMSRKMLSFRESTKILRSDEEFSKVLTVFASVITYHFIDIKKSLTKHIKTIGTNFPNMVSVISRRGEMSRYHREDMEYAQDFDDRIKDNLKDIFSV